MVKEGLMISLIKGDTKGTEEVTRGKGETIREIGGAIRAREEAGQGMATITQTTGLEDIIAASLGTRMMVETPTTGTITNTSKDRMEDSSTEIGVNQEMIKDTHPRLKM